MSYIVEARDANIHQPEDYPLVLTFTRSGLTGPRFTFACKTTGKAPYNFDSDRDACKSAFITAEDIAKRWSGQKKIEFRVLLNPHPNT